MMTSRIVKVARDSKLEIAVDIWCGRKLIKSFLQWQYRLASSVATPVACQQVMSKKKTKWAPAKAPESLHHSRPATRYRD